jgi:hypothetical protein
LDNEFSRDFPLNPILCSSQNLVTPVSAAANALAVSSGSMASATLSGVFPTPGKCQAADSLSPCLGSEFDMAASLEAMQWSMWHHQLTSLLLLSL